MCIRDRVSTQSTWDIMKALFLVVLLGLSLASTSPEVPQMNLEEFIETLRGVFEAWEVNKEEVEKLLLCVHDLGDIKHQIEIIMEEIKKISMKDIIKLVEVIVKLFVAVQQIFKDIEPCIDAAGELKKLLEKIIHLTPVELFMKLFHNIMENGKQIYNDIIAMINAYYDGNYYDFGYYLGDVLEILFLKDELRRKQPIQHTYSKICLLYTSPSPRDLSTSRMPSSA
eukprot:TRINITY_DN38_c0_g1_i1.p1 TRINITY_DN38_c0_g1~~TRINITY_DN38_c0_g1_i1.p1  ORF type:complete len:226 (-),score=86.29 TRINITY_DN38_c0_g1_i1:19-696(-)